MKRLAALLVTILAASSLVANATVITSVTGEVESISRDDDVPVPNGTVRQKTPNPLPFPFSTTLSTSVGNSTNTTQVDFQSGDTFAEFAITVDHSIDNRNGDLNTTMAHTSSTEPSHISRDQIMQRKGPFCFARP